MNGGTDFSRDSNASYEERKNKCSRDQGKPNLATALLRLDTAGKNLKNATVTAPIGGVIVSRPCFDSAGHKRRAAVHLFGQVDRWPDLQHNVCQHALFVPRLPDPI